MAQTGAELSVDDILAAMSNVQRRKLLESLLTDSPPDDTTPVVTVQPDIAMHHTHLPKLDDYGLINWDEDTNRVTRGPQFEAAEELLSHVADHDDPSAPKQ